jgi:predicted CXXCH cytochrome family protein
MKLTLVHVTRNKQGHATRVEETLEGDEISIGRNAGSRIHLTDARAPLNGARLRSRGGGEYSIEAGDSDLQVDGSTTRASVLKVGQKIGVGPYIMVVEALAEAQLTLSLELTGATVSAVQDVVEASPIEKETRLSLGDTWLSKRALSWGLVVPLLLAFLIWPVYHALYSTPGEAAKLPALTADQSWDPGPLDSGHATFGRDCVKCHQQAFVQVKNDACETCHAQIGWHFALDKPEQKALHDAVFSADESGGRCAACHRDHKGLKALKRQDAPLCVTCHVDLKTRHNTVATVNVGDFANDHPSFMLSMQALDERGRPEVKRVLQKEGVTEKSNLKFPHDVHVTSKGVRSPTGKQVLNCSGCHEADPVGARFKPIEMKKHCQECHTLSFEPAASGREVPHGSVTDVVAAVNEFYSHASMTKLSVDGQAGAKSGTWAKTKAAGIVDWMMGKDGTCGICHSVTQDKANKTWKVEPILQTLHWMPKSRFTHFQHNTFACESCHNPQESKKSADVLMPDIDDCRACHSGNVLEKDKARGTCETCHGFHVAGSRSGQPAIHAASPAALAIAANTSVLKPASKDTSWHPTHLKKP